MAKRNDRRNDKRNEGRKLLWEKWQRLRATTDDALQMRIDEIFQGLEHAACEQLSTDAARFARLGGNDETVYLHLVKMMRMYRSVIDLSSQAVNESPGLAPSINGICEVLSSRLKEFEDTASGVGMGVNPVSQEKRAIVEGAVLYVTREADNLASQFVRSLKADKPEVWAALCAGAAAVPIEDMIVADCFSMMYTHYQEGLRFCLAGLDDLHARKNARFYTELIELGWEELSNIITVQVLHIESSVSGTDVEKVPTIHRILDILRELYQQTGPLIAELQKLLQTPPLRPAPCRSIDEFTDVLGASIVKSDGDKNSDAFLSALASESDALFGQMRSDFMKATYQLQRIISGELLLAEEIKGAFIRTRAALEEINLSESTPPQSMDEKEVSIQRDILRGIFETIEIKIESLNDSFDEFNKKGLVIVRDFTAEKPDIPPEERQAAIDKVLTAWTAEPPKKLDHLSAFFEKCWNGEAYKSCRERVARQINAYFEKTEKSAFVFKKEVMLYEICTYEEILTHSVSRLRESPWEESANAAALLDDSFKELEVLLKKNNINVIRPAAHDQFNAQEHEVLVAEKQEGFAKGAVIKVINSGYRHKEQIILRANVIAAR